MARIDRDAPAKINLTLDVLQRRPDGFHEIRSLMIPVDLMDRLELESAAPGRIELRCDAADIPTDERNLVYQAARRLNERIGGRGGCRIMLRKRTPAGGGLGGGSSDAAAALMGLNELWEAGLSGTELASIGAEIGSDVPFFFGGACSIVSGRGDCVRPFRMPWRGWAALIMAGVHVSTAEVYARCVPAGPAGARRDEDQFGQAGSAAVLRRLCRNDLEPAIFEVAPRVREVRDAVAQLGFPEVRVSGAGSVLYVLFDEESEAQQLAQTVIARGVVDRALAVRAPFVTD